MGAISCRQRTMRSGGMLGAELEKSSAPRCDIEGSSRPQLKVVMWAVMVDMLEVRSSEGLIE